MARSSTRPRRCLLLDCGDASYSVITKPSREVFYSSAARSSTRPQQCLLLIHDVGKSEGLLLLRGDVFCMAATAPLSRSLRNRVVKAKLSGRGGLPHFYAWLNRVKEEGTRSLTTRLNRVEEDGTPSLPARPSRAEEEGTPLIPTQLNRIEEGGF